MNGRHDVTRGGLGNEPILRRPRVLPAMCHHGTRVCMGAALGWAVAMSGCGVSRRETSMSKPAPSGEYELMVVGRPTVFEVIQGDDGVGALVLARDSAGVLAVWGVFRAAGGVREDAGAILYYSRRTAEHWPAPQQVNPIGTSTHSPMIAAGKGTVVLSYTRFSSSSSTCQVWRGEAWSDPFGLPGSHAIPHVCPNGKLVFFWVENEPGGWPVVSSNFTHTVLKCGSATDTGLMSKVSEVNLSKHHEENYGSADRMSTIDSGHDGAAVVMLNNVIGLASAKKRGGYVESIVSVVSYDVSTGNAEHQQVAKGYISDSFINGQFACSLSPGESYVFWLGPDAGGDAKGAAMYGAFSENGRWHELGLIASLGADSYRDYFVSAVTVDGTRKAIVLWHCGDNRMQYVLGRRTTWTSPKTLVLPIHMKTMTEAAPGTLGVMGYSAGSPAYVEVRVAPVK